MDVLPPKRRLAGPPRRALAPRVRRAPGARGLGSTARAVATSAVFAGALLGALLGATSAPAGEWAENRARAAIVSAAEVGLRAPACELVPLSAADGDAVSPRAAPAPEREAGDAVDAQAPTGASVRRFEGRVTLVDFWASWCPTCEHAFAELDALAREHRGAGFEVVAINLDADPRDARAFLAGRELAFEVVRDATGRCPRGFGLVGMPQAFLIDASGRVRAVTRGFREGEAKAMREQIEALLAGATEALPAVAAGPGDDGGRVAAPVVAPSPAAR